MRVMRSALEARWKSKVAESHEVWPMLVAHASFLLNRCEVGHDGKTAYERLKKKVATIIGLDFGEIVHWKKTIAPGKLSPYLGVGHVPGHPRGLRRGLGR